MHSGDIGRFDADGFLYFMDRKADYMRRRGENVSAYELEEVFIRHPAIADVAVLAVPSPVTEDDIMVDGQVAGGVDPHRGRAVPLVARRDPLLRAAALHRVPRRVAPQ